MQKTFQHEFYDYMTGEIFFEDKTTLRDVLDSEYLTIHELVEISELKKNYRWIITRLDIHETSVLKDDPNLPRN